MNKVFLVKLGGSLITDKTKPYTPRLDVIKRISKEIKDSVLDGISLIIGHGGGSYPHVSASKYQTHRGCIHEDSVFGMTIVHNDAMRLNSIIIEELLKNRVNAFSIQPSSIAIAEKMRIKDIYVKPIEIMIKYGIIPVIYGDVAVDLSQGCCILSTEEIFKHLVINLKRKYTFYIVMVEEVDGIYTRDPFKYSDAEFIEIISKENINTIRGYLSSSHGIDVTGGMKHKVDVLFELAKEGIESIIINGLVNENLKNTLKGKTVKGTKIKY